MLKVYPIAKRLRKYCTQCDEIADFEICCCNPSVIMQGVSIALCTSCAFALKEQLEKNLKGRIVSKKEVITD